MVGEQDVALRNVVRVHGPGHIYESDRAFSASERGGNDHLLRSLREVRDGEAVMRIAEEDGGRWSDAGEPLGPVSVVNGVAAILALNGPPLWIVEVLAEFAIGDLK